MSWKATDREGHESRKISAMVVPYTRGRCLDIGCGVEKCFPNMIGVDNGHHWGRGAADIQIKSADDLSIFADESLDGCYSSHLLEHMADPGKTLREWARVIKPGGYLTLYVPSANLYPKVGEPGANPDHRWDVYPGDIARLLRENTTCGWTQVENEERNRDGDGWGEYSLFEVYRKRTDGQFVAVPWDEQWKRDENGVLVLV